MATNTTYDLHALFATRALGKLRFFLATSSSRGGAGRGDGGKSAGTAAVGLSRSPAPLGGGTGMGVAIVNAEVNKKDHLGRTVLHLAVMEVAEWALEWVEVLLTVPGLAVNAVDTESSWTALHRALYAGNISAARLLLMRNDVDARLKDNEGLTPFDLYNSTVEGTNPSDIARPAATLPQGEDAGRRELFTWGANRNYVLGLAGDGDRAFPERVQLKREESGLLQGVQKFEPLRVRDVVLARLHSGILTDEKSNNVRLCGYGTGGRLGQTAQTQFAFTSLTDFPHQVASIVLSPDHTVIITTTGAVYTFGQNRFDQLGYTLDTPLNLKSDDPIQSTPRRVVGPLKKEVVLGAAASRTHTAVFTADSLFTWGTSRGQLGYSIQGSQVLPRKVTQAGVPCIQLCATENATACLLETKDVIVLYHDSCLKIVFPLARFPSKMQAYRPPQVSSKPNINKVTSCGNTFAALSSLGDVFTFTLDSSTSTASSPTPSTSYNDIPSSVARITPKPQRIWSLRRKFTAVTDVGVGLDGAIILCTVSGHVFVRTKRFTKTGSASTSNSPSGWKFQRVPYLQRCVRVAANSTGAFAAIRADVPLRPMDVVGPSLAESLLRILPHWIRLGLRDSDLPRRAKHEAVEDESDDEEDVDVALEKEVEVALILFGISEKWDAGWEMSRAGADAVVVAGRLQIPVHRLLLSIRSQALDFAVVELGACSEITALLLVHYLYTDQLPAIWDSRVSSRLRDRNPTVQVDVENVKLELQQLARRLRLQELTVSLNYHIRTPPTPTLVPHLRHLLSQPTSLTNSSSIRHADLVLVLADHEVICHSVILRARCSIFETFYEDGDWTRNRRGAGLLRFDLQHWRWDVMRLVIEHIYFDAGVELFDTIEKPSADEYINFVTEVLAAANELLLDKLKLVCSSVLSRFVRLHNVCSILVDAAFFEANELVRACMHFIASSMETVLEGRLLDDLPPDLISAVSGFCQERQGTRMPVSRSGVLVNELMVKHASWLAELDLGKPTGGVWKLRPVLPRSPVPSPSQLSPGPSPHLHPLSSPSLQPRTSPALLATRFDEPFAMDEDFSLDRLSNRTIITSTLSQERRHSSAPNGSPATTSFTPLGSPPPPRLQPWSSAAAESSKTPLDLREIIASEVAASRSSRPGSSDRPDTSIMIPQRTITTSSTRGSATPSSWRSPLESSRPSFVNIQPAQSSNSAQPSVPNRSEISRPIIQRAPIVPRPVQNTSSAVGAPVITPSRGSGSRTVPGSRVALKASFGASDVPWTNYTVAPVTPVLDSFDVPSTPPLASFAYIQSQQIAEVAAIKETKAPRSFAEVMAQEALEAQQRAEAQEFERWWASESEKVIASQPGPSRGGRTTGTKSGKPRSRSKASATPPTQSPSGKGHGTGPASSRGKVAQEVTY